MKTRKHKQNKRGDTVSRPRLSKAKIEALIEEGIVDCYNESEQATGLYTMIEDNLRVPFDTEVLGVPVTVNRG